MVDVDITGNYAGEEEERGVGGLVGFFEEGTITNVHVQGRVQGNFETGGLVGFNKGEITKSSSFGSVSSLINKGGLVGRNEGLISECYSESMVTGGMTNSGGLVGYNYYGQVLNSHASGDVSALLLQGGLVGEKYDGSVLKSYSTGAVGEGFEGNGGGLIGIPGVATVADCFWDTETSGRATSYGGTGKTTVQMKTISTFNNTQTEGLNNEWDIIAVANDETRNTNYIWNIVAGSSYPFLSWKPVPVVKTLSATNIGYSLATLRGKLVSLDGNGEVEIFFEYRKDGEESWTSSLKETMETVDYFSETVTELESDTSYEYRAVVEYQDGELSRYYYGETFIFETLKEEPEVVTLTPSGVTTSSATLRGEVTSLGDYEEVDYLFEYKKTSDSDWDIIGTGTKDDIGVFNALVTGLTSSTNYEYRAVVGYGGEDYEANIIEFTTATDSSPGGGGDPDTQDNTEGELSCSLLTKNSVRLSYTTIQATSPSIFRSNTKLTTINSGNRTGTHTDTGLTPNTSYTYYLRNGTSSTSAQLARVVCKTLSDDEEITTTENQEAPNLASLKAKKERITNIKRLAEALLAKISASNQTARNTLTTVLNKLNGMEETVSNDIKERESTLSKLTNQKSRLTSIDRIVQRVLETATEKGNTATKSAVQSLITTINNIKAEIERRMGMI
jgi:hypothetical protein